MQRIKMVDAAFDAVFSGVCPVFPIQRVDIIPALGSLYINKINLARFFKFSPVNYTLVTGNINAADRVLPGEGIVELEKDENGGGDQEKSKDVSYVW
jgi:hypothetical protein